MTETINRRLGSKQEFREWLNTRTLVIIDEAHLSIFDKLFEHIPDTAYVIGATATPYRKGKSVKGLDEFYQHLVQRVDTPDLIQQGYLAQAITYSVPIDLSGAALRGGVYDTSQIFQTNKTYHGVVNNYLKHTPNQKALLFASNVESSKRVCQEFNEHGLPARHLDGTTPDAERTEILEWFANTENAILCNCGVLRAGYDQPDIRCIILYLATTSKPSYLQMCGRGSRIADGKTTFTILDFGDNVRRLDMWEAPREWSLEKVSKGKGKTKAAPVKDCPTCTAMNYASATVCVACGTPFPKPKQEETPEVELKRVIPSELVGKRLSQLSVHELIRLQESGAYGKIYVQRVIRARGIDQLEIYRKLMGYKSGWMFHQKPKLNDVKFADYTIK